MSGPRFDVWAELRKKTVGFMFGLKFEKNESDSVLIMFSLTSVWE